MAYLDDDSLQYLCIKSISEDFDRFCATYTSPDCTIPKRYYEFIQQMYTHEILQLLLDRDTLKNEHLVFIINKYIKELDLYHFPENCDLEVVKERLLDVGNTLTKFSMSGESSFSTLHTILWNLSSIEVLELEYTNCADESLKIIVQNCPFIKTLNVYACCDVTDDGIKTICSQEHNKIVLENLDVDRTSVTDEGIAYVLENMPSLQTITYDKLPRAICSAANKKMQGNELVIDKVYNLTSIAISSPSFTLKLCALLCPFIKDLTINNIDMEDQIETCSTFKYLESVTMECNIRVPDLCINNLLIACGPTIQQLRLLNFTISAEVVALNCPKLRYLRLDNPTFQSICTVKTAPLTFPKLRSFHLDGTSLECMSATKSTAFIINSSPGLEMLSIKFSQFSAEIKEVVLKCTSKLRKINFSSTPVDMDFLQEILLRHTSLAKLIIENCGITGSEYDNLLEVAENIDSEVDIIWEDCSEDIRALLDIDYPMFQDGESLKISHLLDGESLYP